MAVPLLSKTFKSRSNEWKALVDEELKEISRLREEIHASHERTAQAAIETRALMAKLDVALTSLRNP